MKIIKIILILISTSLSLSSIGFDNLSYYAKLPSADLASLGQSTGNGGDIVVCNNNGIETYEILDFYEAKELHGVVFDLPKTGNETDRALYHLRKVGLWKYYSNYVERVKEFKNRIEFVSKKLDDIPDSFHTYIPSHCRLEQIAINKLNGKVEINESLWNKLDFDQKGVLILHELFYEDMILSGHMNSIVARELNSLLLGSKFYGSYTTLIDQILKDELSSKIITGGDLLIENPFLFYKTTPFEEVKLYLMPTVLNKEQDNQLVQQYIQTEVESLLNDTAMPKGKERYFSKLQESLSGLNQTELAKYEQLQTFFIGKLKNLVTQNDQLNNTSALTSLLFEFFRGDTLSYEGFRDLIIPTLDQCFSDSNKLHNCNSTKEIMVQLVKDIPYSDPLLFDFIANHLEEFWVNRTFLFYLETHAMKLELPATLLDKMISYIEYGTIGSPTIFFNNALKVLYRQNYRIDVLDDYIVKTLRDHRSPINLTTDIYWVLISLRDENIFSRLEPAIIDEFIKADFILIGHVRLVLEYYHNHPIPKEIVKSIFKHFRQNSFSNTKAVKDVNGLDMIDLALKVENFDPAVLEYLAYVLRFESPKLKKLAASYLEQAPYLDNLALSTINQEMRQEYKNPTTLTLLLNILKGRPLTEEIKSYLRYLVNHPDQTVGQLAKELLI